MVPVIDFPFENSEALGPRENILLQGGNDIAVRLFRSMRQKPLLGMKQPALNGAILGMETILEMTAKGYPAVGYRWKIYRGKKLIQSGMIDSGGMSGDIKIGLPGIETERYQISIFEPTKKR